MDWYKITLSRDQVASGILSKIQMDFNTMFLKNGAPKGVAVLNNISPGGMSTPLENYLYFSPNSVKYCEDIIAKLGGEPCHEPSPNEANLLAGDNAFLSGNRPGFKKG